MPDLLVGMDRRRDPHHVAFADATATSPRNRLTLPHDAGGALPLAQVMRKPCAVRIGCEAPGRLCLASGALVEARPRIHLGPGRSIGQPRTVRRYLATFASNYRQDPWRIAEVLSHPPWLPRPFQPAALPRLARHRHPVVRLLTRLCTTPRTRTF